ncbi:MAG: mismatch repair protein MutS [Mucilaginibacter sp.]|nr:mismatch repair protein MutS [Mucilaginibacter sp.]
MAFFEIDRQTINDLEVFNEARSGISIFTFFDIAKTIGGRKKLIQMMETPSVDINVLTSRRDSIKYFYDNPVNLDINKRSLDFIEHYLAFNTHALTTNFIDAVAKGIRYKFKSNNDQYVISQGISDVFKLLKTLHNFCSELVNKETPAHINTIIDTLNAMLSKKEIEKVINWNPGKELSYIQLCYYDKLFRKTELQSVRSAINIVYELDVYIAAAKAAAENGFSFPEYCTDKQSYVAISGLFHPCIKKGVKNDILIDNEQNLVFLTGANMAGKSSFLRSMGLAVYLAHIGFPVPAGNMQTSVFNGLITTINLSDNISNGYSHYYSEVKRVKEIAQKILEHGNMFIIFDELFRGTNVKDAYDASLATIKALANITSSVFLISTHIVEITAELINTPNISFRYFSSKIEGGKPVFEYKLLTGVSSETMGFFIFKNEGILEILEKATQKKETND